MGRGKEKRHSWIESYLGKLAFEPVDTSDRVAPRTKAMEDNGALRLRLKGFQIVF